MLDGNSQAFCGPLSISSLHFRDPLLLFIPVNIGLQNPLCVHKNPAKPLYTPFPVNPTLASNGDMGILKVKVNNCPTLGSNGIMDLIQKCILRILNKKKAVTLKKNLGLIWSDENEDVVSLQE